MAAFVDNSKFNPTAGGTTDWTYSTAVTGYQSPAAAGAVNGTTYAYYAASADLSQWEIGTGTWNSGTLVLARTAVLYNSSGNTSKITFSSAPTVAIVALAEDLTVTHAAVKADQQTGTSLTLAVVPGIQQQHDSAAKAWVSFVGSTGAISASYNVSGVVRNSAGNYTVSFTTAFASAAYAAIPSLNSTTTTAVLAVVSSQAAGNCVIQTFSSTVVAGDPSGKVYLVCYGQQ